MSDEEIYQALGSAQASEDGIAKAMAIVEEQANLREHDNKLFAEWFARMQASPEPEAKIALENIERAKQGLEALPFTSPTPDVAAALNEVHQEQQVPEVIEVQEVLVEEIIPESLLEVEVEEEPLQSIFADLPAESSPEPVLEEIFVETIEVVVEPQIMPEAEPADDSFDALLAEAASEATSSIAVPSSTGQAAVTFEVDEPKVENFEVSADEDALVVEESSAKTAKSGWWSNASFWVLVTGVFVPVVAAFLVLASGFSLGTALVGFAIGLFVNFGLAVSAHFTGKRSGEPNVVTSRATFGVFGASLPGLGALGFAIVVLNLVAIGATASFDGVFDTQVDFGDELFSGLTYSSAIPITLVVCALVVAGFAPKAVRWINAVLAAALLVAFVVAAVVSRDVINFDGLDTSIDLQGALLIAAALACIGIANYGKAPNVSAVGTPANTVARWSTLVIATVALPMAVFAHFVLVFDQTQPANGFALLHALGLGTMPALVTPLLWITAIAMFGLLINLGHSALTQLRAFGINQLRGWFAIIVSLTATAMWVLPEWSTWLDLSLLLVVPLAAGVGFAVADSLVRRGKYHEASLLRSYGFYGKFNLLALAGYLASVAVGFAIAQPLALAPWLGFAGWTTPFAPLAALAFALVWSAATGIPRILVQQREVAEVEQRKASLSEFTGFSE
jgi:purine-cytosine permease-like protein